MIKQNQIIQMYFQFIFQLYITVLILSTTLIEGKIIIMDYFDDGYDNGYRYDLFGNLINSFVK